MVFKILFVEGLKIGIDLDKILSPDFFTDKDAVTTAIYALKHLTMKSYVGKVL